MTELTSKTIAELRDGFRSGEFTAREIADSFNAAVAAAKLLNAYTVETPDDALAAADLADQARLGGELKPLSGIPLGIKDLFATQGVDTTAGSRILEGFRPTYESTVSGQSAQGGRGHARQTEHGRVRDGLVERDQRLGPGDQPVAAARAAMSPDPGRIVGRIGGGGRGGNRAGRDRHRHRRLDPPARRLRRHLRDQADLRPLLALGDRQLRKLARPGRVDGAGRVRDCAILLEAMAGFDPKDSTSLDLPVPQWEANLSSDLKGKRVGIPKEYRIDGVPADINELWDRGIEWLKDAGATPVEISLPHTKYALPTYYIIAPAEASSNLARYDGVRYGLREEGVKTLDDMYAATRAAGFGAEVKRRIMIGTYVLSAGFYDAYFTKAQKVRTLIKQDFAQGVRAVRRDPDPDRALGRVRHRRDDRSAGDVSERRVRGPGEPRRPAGDERPRRPRRTGPSARPAPDRQRARRADRAQRRPRDRGARGLHRPAGEVVVRFAPHRSP